MDRSQTGRSARYWTWLLAAGIAVCSFAATPPNSSASEVTIKGEIVSALVLILQDDTVRTQLQLTTAQAAAVDKCLGEIAYPLWQVREATDAETKLKCAHAFDHLELTLAAALTATQRTRLDGILLQTHGWPGVFAPRIVGALKLSDDQQTRIREALAAHKAETTAGDSQPIPAKLNKQIDAILTTDQRARLTTMIGPRFDPAQIRKRYCRAPPLTGIDEWINTTPLDWKQLEGKVVVVHFWAFGCINCVHNLPHYQAWHEKFAGEGVVTIGMHTPETATERATTAVRAKVAEYKIAYPVAIDGAAKNWNAWGTRWWPSVYLVDKRGYIRYWWAGELNWQGAEGEALMTCPTELRRRAWLGAQSMHRSAWSRNGSRLRTPGSARIVWEASSGRPALAQMARPSLRQAVS